MTISSVRNNTYQQSSANKTKNTDSEFNNTAWKVYQTHALSVKENGLIEKGAEMSEEEAKALGPVYNLTEERIRLMMEQSNRAFTYTQNKGFNKAENSISLVPGMGFDMGNNSFLEIGAGCVMNYDGIGPIKSLNTIDGALSMFIRIANNQFTFDEEYQTRGFYADKNAQATVIKALANMGIDTNQPFYVNGSKFVIRNGAISKM